MTKFSESFLYAVEAELAGCATLLQQSGLYSRLSTKSLRRNSQSYRSRRKSFLLHSMACQRSISCEAILIIVSAVETTRLLRENLKLNEATFPTTFQSRFGKTDWLQPYTDVTCSKLGQKRHQNVRSLRPVSRPTAFETLEEISMENAAIFKQSGRQNFIAIPS